MRGALQFVHFLQEGILRPEPVRYKKLASTTRFMLIVRVHGRSPTSSFLLCPLLHDAIGLLQGENNDFPPSGAYKVVCVHHRTLFTAFGIRTQDPSPRTPNWRPYIGQHAYEYLVILDGCWERHPEVWALGV